MNWKILLFLISVISISSACSEKDESTMSSEVIPQNEEPIKIAGPDSILRVNECSNTSFTSLLEEYPNLDSNAFRLTIVSKDGAMRKVHVLNVRPRNSSINYCTEEYTVVGFSCGGPCYAQVFVFTKEDRPSEQFGYAQQIHHHPNLIAHIEDEELQVLTIHNFENGKDLRIDISDNHWTNWGQVDTMYMVENKLVLNYSSSKEKRVKKVVSLESILKRDTAGKQY